MLTQDKNLLMENVIDNLNYILENPDKMNLIIRCHRRPPQYTRALEEAVDILPEGKMKRGLNYVLMNEGAEFHFGGKDIVGPAIKTAVMLLRDKAA